MSLASQLRTGVVSQEAVTAAVLLHCKGSAGDPSHKAKPVPCSGNRLPAVRCQDNLAVPLADRSPCSSEQAGLTNLQANEPSENSEQKVVLLSVFLCWSFASPCV